MSCYETIKGRIRKIDTKGKSIEDYIKDKIVEEDPFINVNHLSDYDIQDWMSDFNYFKVNDTLWYWEKQEVKYDDIDSFCVLTPISDDTFEVFTQFYNGGTYADEIVSEEVERYEKEKH